MSVGTRKGGARGLKGGEGGKTTVGEGEACWLSGLARRRREGDELILAEGIFSVMRVQDVYVSEEEKL